VAKVREEYEFEVEIDETIIRKKYGKVWRHALPRPRLVIEYDDTDDVKVQEIENLKQKIVAKGKRMKLKNRKVEKVRRRKKR